MKTDKRLCPHLSSDVMETRLSALSSLTNRWFGDSRRRRRLMNKLPFDNVIRRRRQCCSCNERFTTYEIREEIWDDFRVNIEKIESAASSWYNITAAVHRQEERMKEVEK